MNIHTIYDVKKNLLELPKLLGNVDVIAMKKGVVKH